MTVLPSRVRRSTLGTWTGRLAVLFSILFAFSFTHAQANVIDDLRSLTQQGQYQQAVELGNQHRAEWEGELMFDFYYGLAAIETGEFSEGIFALERVVMRRPGFTRARLELARGYFLREEDTRANHHFNRALAQDPPEPVVATIERYQQRIQERAGQFTTQYSGHAGVGLGYDTNVNSATSSDSIETVLGTFTLGESSLAQSDTFFRAYGQVNVSRPLTAANRVAFFQGNLESRNHFEESDFNTLSLGARAGMRFQGETFTPSVALRGQRFFLDGDPYQDLFGLTTSLTQRLSDLMMANYSAQYMALRNDDRPNSEANVALVSTGLMKSWPVQWQPMSTVAVFVSNQSALESTTAAEANTDRWQYGLNGQVRLHINPEWTVTPRAQYRRSDYAGESPLLTGGAREEHFYQLGVGADWTPTDYWQITPSAQFSHNSSNIDLYEYSRFIIQAQAQYNF